MGIIRRASQVKERLAGPASRRAGYFTLAQASYSCLAGSFEMPMAFRLTGRIDYVAFVYAFYYMTLFVGFAAGMVAIRSGKASHVYRASLILWSGLGLAAVIFFDYLRAIPALVCYFLIRGMAEGLFWAARHRAFLWAVRDAGRDRFALRLQSIVVSLQVVLPLLGGAAITFFTPALSGASVQTPLPVGYRAVFLFTGIIMLVFLLLSPKLEIARSPLSWSALVSLARLKETRSWSLYNILVGLAGSLITIAAGIQTFGVLKTEFRIGALTAGIALLSSLSFLVIGHLVAGRKGVRLHGVFFGALADFSSRTVYALAATTLGLLVKSFLDALIVPFKTVLGENVQFSLIERLEAKSGSSASELYLYREALLFLSRLGACAITGVVFAVALYFSGSASESAPRFAARILLAMAAPVALLEFVFIKGFARANERALNNKSPSAD